MGDANKEFKEQESKEQESKEQESKEQESKEQGMESQCRNQETECQKERLNWCQRRQSWGQQSCSGERGCGKGRKFEMMKAMMDRRIAEAVDQRINALLPCLKQQLAQAALPAPTNDQAHPNVTCMACKASPVAGVYYECPACYKFHLCSKCEEVTPHPHNLLKIKHPEMKEEKGGEEEHGWRKHGGRHGGWHGRWHGHHSSSSRERQPWRRMRVLSSMFEGHPEDYKLFIESRPALSCWELVQAYSAEHKLNEKEVLEKYVGWRAKKLSRKLGKTPEECEELVREHIGLDWRALFDLAEKGMPSGPSGKAEEETNALMVEMFGAARKEEMEKFVREHLKEGTDAILSKWIEANY